MKEDCDRPTLKSFAAGTSGISLLGRGCVEGRHLGKKTGVGAGESTAHPIATACCPKVLANPWDAVMESKTTLEQGWKQMAWEENQGFWIIFQGHWESSQQGHTQTHPATGQGEPVWVRQPHAAKLPPCPCGQPQHFPAQGRHLVGVLSAAGATELCCTSAMRCTTMCWVFLLTTAPTILSCASLIYLPFCVSGAACWFAFSPCPALKDGDWSQQISTLAFDREAALLQWSPKLWHAVKAGPLPAVLCAGSCS